MRVRLGCERKHRALQNLDNIALIMVRYIRLQRGGSYIENFSKADKASSALFSVRHFSCDVCKRVRRRITVE